MFGMLRTRSKNRVKISFTRPETAGFEQILQLTISANMAIYGDTGNTIF